MSIGRTRRCRPYPVTRPPWFAQPAALGELGGSLRGAGLSVTTLSGYTPERIRRANRAHRDTVLGMTDPC